jgi:5-methylcytosine-specific restriction endonuclease McrA
MASFTEVTREELEELYKWHSTAGIAAKYGVSPETVRKRFVKLGPARRKKGGRRDFDPPAKDLAELYQSMSMAQIAEKFNVGETVVWKRLHEHGIELRDFKNHRLILKPGRVFSKNPSREHQQRSARQDRPAESQLEGWKSYPKSAIAGSIEYREWKLAVLNLRGNKCQECGRENGWECDCCGHRVVLHVHHVESFARVPERRFDPTNSGVLCSKCHHRRHRSKPRELLERLRA